jgi:hypothetical protein
VSTAGYIKLSRKFVQDDWWEPGRPRTKAEAWIDLLFLARFAPGPKVVGSHVVALERGELLASLRYLADRWGWSTKRVTAFLTQGANLSRISNSRETPVGTVYAIVNYERYNPIGLAEETPKKQLGEQTGNREETPRGTKNKKGKKEKHVTTSLPAAPEPVAGGWVADAVEVYGRHIGIVEHGRAGKVLQPVVDKYGWPAVKPLLDCYGRRRPYQQRDGSFGDPRTHDKDSRWCSLEDFVKTLATWQGLMAPFLDASGHPRVTA